MSKPTLEERVAALERVQHRQELELCRQSPAYFTAHYAAAKAGPDRVPVTHGGTALDTNDQDVLRGGDFSLLIQDDPYDVALAEAILTSDPQEPYRLDTKPREEDWTIGATKLAQQRFGEVLRRLVADKPDDGAIANRVRARIAEWTEDLSGPQKPYRLDPDKRHPNLQKTGSKDMVVIGTPTSDAWYVLIDPCASPKGIPFSVAIEYVKAGRKVRRPSWPPPDTLHLDGGLFNQSGLDKLFGMGKVDVEFNVHLANDWEVVAEPTPTTECPECHKQTEWPRKFQNGTQNPFCDKCGAKIGAF